MHIHQTDLYNINCWRQINEYLSIYLHIHRELHDAFVKCRHQLNHKSINKIRILFLWKYWRRDLTLSADSQRHTWGMGLLKNSCYISRRCDISYHFSEYEKPPHTKHRSLRRNKINVNFSPSFLNFFSLQSFETLFRKNLCL